MIKKILIILNIILCIALIAIILLCATKIVHGATQTKYGITSTISWEPVEELKEKNDEQRD